jgi:hypothetical protein
MIWWILLSFSLPAFALWIFLHEGAHAVTALLCGRKIVEFKPWPHKANERFYFGRVRYDREGNTFISLAPYLVDLVVLLTTAVVLLWIESAIARTVLMLILFCPFINTLVAVQARFRGNKRADLSRAHWGWALPFFYLLLLYAGYIAWQLVCCLQEAVG